MNTGTAIRLARAQARLADARRGIELAREILDDLMVEGELPRDHDLLVALSAAKAKTEEVLYEVMAQLEEAEE